MKFHFPPPLNNVIEAILPKITICVAVNFPINKLSPQILIVPNLTFTSILLVVYSPIPRWCSIKIRCSPHNSSNGCLNICSSDCIATSVTRSTKPFPLNFCTSIDRLYGQWGMFLQRVHKIWWGGTHELSNKTCNTGICCIGNRGPNIRWFKRN